ncbi:MAG: DUF362 domain-containing protein [Treponema sp.]|nr:DUF362 domain-containing protein [Treponema sp.]
MKDKKVPRCFLFVGSHFRNYDFYMILPHFKGYMMDGFGDAIKNMSIGLGSSALIKNQRDRERE